MASLVRCGGNEKHASSQHFLTHHTRTPSQQSAPPLSCRAQSRARASASSPTTTASSTSSSRSRTLTSSPGSIMCGKNEMSPSDPCATQPTCNTSQPTRSDLYSDTCTTLTHPSSETERENGYSCRRDLRSIGCGARLRPAPCARPSARCRSRQHPMRCAAPGRRWPSAPCSARTRPATRNPSTSITIIQPASDRSGGERGKCRKLSLSDPDTQDGFRGGPDLDGRESRGAVGNRLQVGLPCRPLRDVVARHPLLHLQHQRPLPQPLRKTAEPQPSFWRGERKLPLRACPSVPPCRPSLGGRCRRWEMRWPGRP